MLAEIDFKRSSDNDRWVEYWFSHLIVEEALVDGCQNPRKDGAAKKVGMALAFISAAPCSRTLGGKRWLGDKPCQGRQPPEAGAPSRPRELPSKPSEFHTELLTEPDLILSHLPARAIAGDPIPPLHC